ncbi:MAG: zinc-binding dehydrogenase [Leptospira sp.]|nr:zinc-binding dehydrogenase [Leptospira sp.]
MKAIILEKYEEAPELKYVSDRKVPELKENEVLIANQFGSINPSDLMFIRGLYGIKKKLPVVPGFEGSGIVEKVGSAVKTLKAGDRVSVVSGQGDGTWGEMMVTDETSCIPLIDSVTLEQGASLFVNPMTAWAMFEKARKEGHKALIQTAGASALGKMIIRLGKENNFPIISIVRREDQVKQLHDIGGENVLNSSDPRFDRELLVLSKKLSATICLDAVAGDVAGKILMLMPAESKLVSYGALSEQSIPVNAGVMIFQKKVIEGFWLTNWIQEIGLKEFHKEAKKVQEKLGTTFHSEIQKTFSVEEGEKAIEFYKKNMSNGKVLIAFK